MYIIIEEQLVNLLISIFGSAITMTVAYLWKFRRLFEKSKFHNQNSAEKDIIKDIKKSKILKVYAMCGSTFSDRVNSNIAKKAFNEINLEQQYLISDENNRNIKLRQAELPKDASNLKIKVKNSINEFEAAKNGNNKIEFRLHKNKVGFRLIILDNCLYLSQQEKGKFGKDTGLQRIPHGTPAYINFSNYFDELWNSA